MALPQGSTSKFRFLDPAVLSKIGSLELIARTVVEGFVSGALSDTVRARAAVRFENAGAWQYSYTRDASIGERKYGAGRVLLDWDATSSLAFELGVTAWKEESDVQAPQARELAFQTVNRRPARHTAQNSSVAIIMSGTSFFTSGPCARMFGSRL